MSPPAPPSVEFDPRTPQLFFFPLKYNTRPRVLIIPFHATRYAVAVMMVSNYMYVYQVYL